MGFTVNPFGGKRLPRPAPGPGPGPGPGPSPKPGSTGIVKPPCELNIQPGQDIPSEYIAKMNQWINRSSIGSPLGWDSQGCNPPDKPRVWDVTVSTTGGGMIGHLQNRDPNLAWDQGGIGPSYPPVHGLTTFRVYSGKVTFMPAHIRTDGPSGYGVYAYYHAIFKGSMDQVSTYLRGSATQPECYAPFYGDLQGAVVASRGTYKATISYPNGKPRIIINRITRVS